MMLFANRLKQLRVKNDLRQRQMSAVLEIDSGLYSKIERGERRAKKEQVLQLACFLHVDEKELLTFWQVDQLAMQFQPIIQLLTMPCKWLLTNINNSTLKLMGNNIGTIQNMKALKFIDLFAGLGGFHLALKELGHECVFASEINTELQELYEHNHKIKCVGDINLVDIKKDIPPHDVLCAGFPCQPFSQAGFQRGFRDDRGNLFYRIMDILEYHKPEFVFLENVPNLKSHDKGNTYKVIHDTLSTLYDVREDIISPHYFGIPQHRTRFYIVGRLLSKGGLKDFKFPQHDERPKCNIQDIIKQDDTDYMSLKEITRKHIRAWQHFLDLLTENKVPLPTYPIWAMEFGANYDFTGLAPYYQQRRQLEGKFGKFGELIQGNSKDDDLLCLPIYAQTNKTERNRQFPDWKKQFIHWNRQFYTNNQSWIDGWIDEIKAEGFENSHQKFEWNCGEEETPTINNKIVQFRPSGIRVKQPTFSPALVLTTTQIPIFPWVITPNGEKGRYMTRHEAAKLQCMDDLKEYPDTIAKAFKAFGNAVNVRVVNKIAEQLLRDYETD